ncbi:MAG: hypothetical protein WB646_03435 [Steroidobacteraceae bacterium]
MTDALELAPNDGESKFLLGRQLAVFGQLEPAIELIRQVLATDPLRASSYDLLIYEFLALNRLDEAEQAIRRALELQPAAVLHHQRLAVIESSAVTRRRRSKPRSRRLGVYGRTSR